MTVSVESFPPKVLDQAWPFVCHEVYAYHGYPDTQQDILEEKAKELLLQSSEPSIKQCGSLTLAETVKIG